MELKNLSKGIVTFIKKYKFVVLILLIGVVLMLLPDTKQGKAENVTIDQEVLQQTSISNDLACILEVIDGVGDVKVLITTGEGEETVYQTDTDGSSGEADSALRTDTVTVTNAERSQTGLIKQVNPPKYLGAVVICKGADDPVVRLAVIDAVSKATGLGANSISVLKMK